MSPREGMLVMACNTPKSEEKGINVDGGKCGPRDRSWVTVAAVERT
jgi:hypothetical protein